MLIFSKSEIFLEQRITTIFQIHKSAISNLMRIKNQRSENINAVSYGSLIDIRKYKQ